MSFTQVFRRSRVFWTESLAVVGCALAVSIIALAWFTGQGYTLYFGDAEAHLNIARRIIDSRTPGVDQIGTVWLPLPHLLMLPFVWNDTLWRTGLAGGLASSCAFVAACALLYASVRRLFVWRAAAVAAVAVFALNPNLLYLESIPMTECAFFASLIALLVATLWFERTPSLGSALAAAVFSNAASLTRYEGWFLIPFVALFFLWKGGRKHWWMALVFGALASVAPVAWLAHNWWYYRNPLEFYNGPYSAMGIYARGRMDFPGDHHWLKAIQYFWAAVKLSTGQGLAWLGLAGAAVALAKRKWWPVLLLVLPPLFYVWSLYGSGAEIHVPNLWPKSYYNTRYGTTMMPLFALGVAAVVASAPHRLRWLVSVAVIAVAVAPWLLDPRRDNWICWKESQVNSTARRAWTNAAAGYLRTRYKSGEGAFTSFGDMTGIFRAAGIPLRDTLHEGNNPQWMGAASRPGLFLKEGWAVAFAGDTVATAVQRANRDRPLYTLETLVIVPHADVIEIYRRNGGDGALARLCRQQLIEDCDGAGQPPASDSGEDDENPVHQNPRR